MEGRKRGRDEVNELHGISYGQSAEMAALEMKRRRARKGLAADENSSISRRFYWLTQGFLIGARYYVAASTGSTTPSNGQEMTVALYANGIPLGRVGYLRMRQPLH